MKTAYVVALFALIVMAAAASSVYAASTCCPGPGTAHISGGCPLGGYDRTPICVCRESDYQGRGHGRGPSSPVTCQAVDPWAKCGAFCYAGQLPAGWNYGWDSEYWLRPDSNF